MIYFVSVDDSYIKIGYSANPNKRISQLQTASPKPLTLHGIINGSQADEQRLHKVFKHLHMRGEWFKLDNAILTYMHSCKEWDGVVEVQQKKVTEIGKRNVDKKKWRVETRTYEKQDGEISVYYNYRRRKGKKAKGKRKNVYMKGGKIANDETLPNNVDDIRVELKSDGMCRLRWQIKNADGTPVTYTTKSGKVGYKRDSLYMKQSEYEAWKADRR